MRAISKRQLNQFRELYLAGETATDAYKSIRPKVTRATASTMGSELVKRLNLSMVESLDRAGVTEETLATKIGEGIEATQTITSYTEPDRVEPDYKTRHKYIETALRLRGHSSNNTVIDNRQVVIQLPTERDETE